MTIYKALGDDQNMQECIIVGANTIDSLSIFQYQMDELKELCSVIDLHSVHAITQNMKHIHPKTYVGMGKVQEIKESLEFYNANIVVCNDELTPSQITHLEKTLEATIIDRTYIILEIFKKRASSKEAMLQVELASLQYQLPRLIGLRDGLSRQRGTGGSLERGRGAGETKLELDRRLIQSNMTDLKSQLKQLTQLRKRQRQRRVTNEIPVVSLVGYTNAGKSSLLNAILTNSKETKKEVLQKDMLFATLQTATRQIKLQDNTFFLLTDTVGFIQKLPHQLVDAFQSTLEEVSESDLIIHVIDSTSPFFLEQIETTKKVLEELGASEIPIIYAFNKLDLLEDYFYIEPKFTKAIKISATANDNIDQLIEMMKKELFRDYQVNTFKIPYENGRDIDYFKEHTQILSFDKEDENIVIQANVSLKVKNQYKHYLV